MISLPKNAIPYIKGLMCVFENANCSSLARVANCSHDSLTRILKEQKLVWQILLTSFALRIFGKLQDGYLIIDDTVISKIFAKKIENLSWVYCSKIGKVVQGLDIVMLAWSNGKLTLPLAIKVYQKNSGKTKIDLALELLDCAKTLDLKPKYVTFDCWYAADKILKKIEQFNWIFITQIKKNRKINNSPVKRLFKNPYWIFQGKLSGGLEVKVVRNGKNYFIANDLSLEKKEILNLYKGRWLVETVFRMLHSKLGIDQCQLISLQAQTAHFYFCLFAFLALEKQRMIDEKTIYQLKQECSFNFRKADHIVNTLIFQGA
ncbi:MAG: transposase [bacterium]|nr:transposase [bacterium]